MQYFYAVSVSLFLTKEALSIDDWKAYQEM